MNSLVDDALSTSVYFALDPVARKGAIRQQRGDPTVTLGDAVSRTGRRRVANAPKLFDLPPSISNQVFLVAIHNLVVI